MILSRIVLQGFKSIQDCDLTLNDLNILIGANGAGKSNLIGFFKLVSHLLNENLQFHISKQGGPESLLHFGRKKTERINAEFYFNNKNLLDDNAYQFSLEPTIDNRMVFSNEKLSWKEENKNIDLGNGHFETKIEKEKNKSVIYNNTILLMEKWLVYHFHDTGENSPIKQIHGINDCDYLRADAKNLAAFLYFLKNNHLSHYERIVKYIRLVAPFFGDFYLKPKIENPNLIELEWTEKNEDTPFKAHYLSDGTLRFICLVTVLLQPEQYQPNTILIDEPELGLHPFAIHLLASLIKSVSANNKQMIISTQSVSLVNEFSVNDLIVVERENSATVFKRLKEKDFKLWLDDYSTGELWEKNIFGGRPKK